MMMMMFGEKEAKLKDGTVIRLRPMERSDEQALYAFFQNMPPELLIYIQSDVTNPRTIQKWVEKLDYDRVLPLLAFRNGEIIGNVSLHRDRHGWKRHIGRVRLVVAPPYQNRGLATLLLNELVMLSHELGVEKLWAEIPLDSVAAINACRNAGFACKSVIEGMFKNAENKLIDVLIMVCDVAGYFDRK